MRGIYYFILMVCGVVCLSAQTVDRQKHPVTQLSCRTCHTCDTPTKNDPCLVQCPRRSLMTTGHSVKDGPAVIVLDEISEQFGPVVFSHNLHAQMSEMSGGCYGCHHYNSSKPILHCKDCHEASRMRSDLSKPDLKGAFHRQCMDCHRQWSRSTECSSCHQRKGKSSGDSSSMNMQSIAKKQHPPVPLPTKLVYETQYTKGKLVTFFHSDHADRFGLQCVDCHQQEGCVRCHDIRRTATSAGKTVVVHPSMTEQHKRCFTCHQGDHCSACHRSTPMDSFDHERSSGWALDRYHQSLACQVCHGKSKKYTALETACTACHSTWSNATFRHSVTGLQLDKNHSGLECENCHAEKDFSKKPSCVPCHEDKSYPKDSPGKSVPEVSLKKSK